MSIRFLPLILISSLAFAQEDTAQLVEPIITDLDRLVESVKKTAHRVLLKITQDCKDS